MPGAARLGDKAQVAADAHGCPACPHPAVGPIVTGSPDVFVNAKPAARLDDLGIHAACCGPNNFQIAKGSPTVYVNGKPLARMQDKAKHCGGTGPIIEGSPDVLIDDGAAAASGLGRYLVRALQIVVQQAMAAKKSKAVSRRDRNPGNTGASSGGSAYTIPVQTPAPAPSKSGSPQPQKPAAQVVAQLVDPTGVPVAGWAYKLTLPDGTVRTGESNGQGYIREDAGNQKGDAHLVLVGDGSSGAKSGGQGPSGSA